MHIRKNKVKSSGKTYRYTQIVKSYRNKRGVPAHKVLASFPELPQQDEDNLRTALAASRKNKAVVIADELADVIGATRVKANHRYLHIAAARSIGQQWGLWDLIAELEPRGRAQVSFAQCVEALTLHRCVAPGSKLKAAAWYPTTALPELQAIPPGRFNNTRVHRALTTLEAKEAELQERIAERVHAREGAFVALFADMTDTWFVGHGPEMAQKGRVKEGVVKRRIGIVLLCDTAGHPLRWKTVPGRYYEGDRYRELVESLGDASWVGQTPVVLDRMMGTASAVEFLDASGLRYLTALPYTEFDAYTDRVPCQPFQDLVLAGTDASHAKDLQRVSRAAKKAGLQRVTPTRYVLDLGILVKETGSTSSDSRQDDAQGPAEPSTVEERPGPVAGALLMARTMRADLESGRVKNRAVLAAQHQCTTETIRQILKLLDLQPQVQEWVLAGRAEATSRTALYKLAKTPSEEQADRFEQLLVEAASKGSGGRRSRLTHAPAGEERPPLRVRCVVHFNPERFIEKRRIALDQVRELEASLDELNRHLASPRSRRTETAVRSEVEGWLRRVHLRKVYRVEIDHVAGQRLHVRLVRDEDAWRKRLRYHGFNLLVAHPDLPLSATELVELYFAKDAVEKDFQTIKSELEIRPIRHRTDLKVRAHVSLCMLALLLKRVLAGKLRAAGVPWSASACLEALETCHLNELVTVLGPTYSITDLTPDQRALLRALDLEHLAEHDAVVERITPR